MTKGGNFYIENVWLAHYVPNFLNIGLKQGRKATPHTTEGGGGSLSPVFVRQAQQASKAKQEALGNATESHSERFLQNNHEKQSQLSKTNRLECGKSVESGATVVLLDCV